MNTSYKNMVIDLLALAAVTSVTGASYAASMPGTAARLTFPNDAIDAACITFTNSSGDSRLAANIVRPQTTQENASCPTRTVQSEVDGYRVYFPITLDTAKVYKFYATALPCGPFCAVDRPMCKVTIRNSSGATIASSAVVRLNAYDSTPVLIGSLNAPANGLAVMACGMPSGMGISGVYWS